MLKSAVQAQPTREILASIPRDSTTKLPQILAKVLADEKLKGYPE